MEKTEKSTAILKLEAAIYKLRSKYHQMYSQKDLDYRTKLLLEITKLEEKVRLMKGELF